MKTMALKLSRIGNSRGVRLPAGLISRYGFGGGMAAEIRDDGLLLKPSHSGKLSWEETAREMAASGENWEEWDNLTDGAEQLPWIDNEAIGLSNFGRKKVRRAPIKR
jgi:antitoxin component of MazEF toxin-antitoxin module